MGSQNSHHPTSSEEEAPITPRSGELLGSLLPGCDKPTFPTSSVRAVLGEASYTGGFQ